MKKHLLLFINTLIILILVVGFALTAFISQQTYKPVIEDDIENISKLTASNIYAEIKGDMMKPLFVAQTMASDSFLKNWLYNEKKNPQDENHQKQMKEYLNTYRQKYQYDSVFTISAYSHTYFYYDGVNKIVSPKNEHDDWYYDFIDSQLPYRLNIDTDEVNTNELTVFVDCRIEGKDGELLGVTGVGVKMSRLQELLQSYETNYDLQAVLIDQTGKVTVSSDSQKIETTNVFEDPALKNFKTQILEDKDSFQMNWYPQTKTKQCIISCYIDNLNWYLIVTKDTQPLRISFQELIKKDIFIMMIVLAMLLALITLIIHWYNKRLSLLLNTDNLTGLPNQQSFKESFQHLNASEKRVLFMFDLDHFKSINDTDGHLEGNRILSQISDILKQSMDGYGIAARWGGDEFIGVFKCPISQAQEIMQKMQKQLSQECHFSGGSVTISIGMTEISPDMSLESLTKLVDQALYDAKAFGRNTIVIK
ncbi:MAG: diguanylate cyclase domain-containing protein [Longibaculum sp.]